MQGHLAQKLRGFYFMLSLIAVVPKPTSLQIGQY